MNVPSQSGRTIGAAVEMAASRLRESGVESPVLEAQLLAGHLLGLDRLQAIARIHEPLSSETWVRFEALVERRAAREPLAYIRGTQEFYGLEFNVSPAVLVPRPETELLVELAERFLGETDKAMLVDVCTGSGCIAVAAAVRLPHLRVVAVDLSAEAIEVAKRNAMRHAVADRVSFLQGDIRFVELPRNVDMLVSNPPYIPSGDLGGLQEEVRRHEPRLALDGGPDGFEIHRSLVRSAFRSLRPGGTIAIEVGMGQAPGVMSLLGSSGFQGVSASKDLQRIERVVFGRHAA